VTSNSAAQPVSNSPEVWHSIAPSLQLKAIEITSLNVNCIFGYRTASWRIAPERQALGVGEAN
jgi:hypothetical protein